MKRLLPALLVAMLVAACRPGIPKQYLQPDEMEDLLYDYHVAQALARQEWQTEDERNYNQSLYFDAVLEKHHVTKAQFDSSMVYYYTRADRFEEVYKRVSKRLSDEALRLGASEGEVNRYSQLNASGDTANVWEGNSSIVLMPYAPYNRVDFYQKADTTYRMGDTFLLYFESDFCFQTGSKEAVVCLTIRYDNDSVVSRANHVSVTGHTQMRLPEVKDHMVKDMRGFIYLGPGSEQSSTLKMMYVHNLQLIRFRQPEVDSTAVEKADSAKAQPTAVHDSTALKAADSGVQRVTASDTKPADSVRGAGHRQPIKLDSKHPVKPIGRQPVKLDSRPLPPVRR